MQRQTCHFFPLIAQAGPALSTGAVVHFDPLIAHFVNAIYFEGTTTRTIS
jgi:hypothetical protein